MTVTINGTTGITSPAATVAAGIGGTPAFSAYMTGLQGVPNSTLTKAQLNLEEFDLTNAYDAVTNFRFQPNVAGYYQINGCIGWAASAVQAYCTLLKNGGELKRGAMSGAASTQYTSNVSAVVYLNGTTDYVELWAMQASGGSVNIGGAGQYNYFQGYLVRAA